LDPNEPFTKSTVIGRDNLLHLVKTTNLGYVVTLGGAALPDDATILQPSSSPVSFNFPMSASDPFSNPDYINSYVAKIDWLIDSAHCQAPQPEIEICTQVTLNGDMVSDFSDADNIIGDSCDGLPQGIPVGQAGSGDGTYKLQVTNTGNETLVDVVINAPDFGLVNEPVPASCGDLEPNEVCIIEVNDPNTAYSNLMKENVCTIPGMVSNIATVNGMGQETGIAVTDDDPAVVQCVSEPHISLLKEVSLNGGPFLDANTVGSAPTGPIGADAEYRLTVTNDGTEALSSIVINDPALGLVDIALGVTLEPGDVEVLTRNNFLFVPLYVQDRCDSIGAHLNTASVSAMPVYSDMPVNAEDVAYVNCESPQIELLKQVSIDGVNFFDADLVTDGDVPVGIVGLTDATYRLIIKNIGSETLTDVLVSDAAIGIETVITDLAPGVTQVIDSGEAGFGNLYQADVCDGMPGNKSNVATVAAIGVSTQLVVSDDNPANVKCITGPAIEIKKQVRFQGNTRFVDADTVAAGPTGLVGDNAIYRFIVKNIGDEDLTNVTVTDGVLNISGVVVADLPVNAEVVIKSGTAGFENLYVQGMCEASGSKLNIAQVQANGVLTNTAVNDEDPAYVNCDAPVSCDISVDQKCAVKIASTDDKLCTESISATTLRYTGPDLNGATVKFAGKDGGSVTYTGVNLESNVSILTKPGQNGYTVDAGNGSKLGSQTTISVNGKQEIIHTSCSAIYVAGQPAPLDSKTPTPANSDKGDPSPSWHVVNFRQKDDVVIAESNATGQYLDSCDIPFGGADVSYSYKVTNRGSTDVSLTSVLDSKFGEILASVPTSLATGEMLTFTKGPIFVDQSVSNTVSVAADVAPYNASACSAVDTVIVNAALAPEYSCADGKPTKLGITYVGGSCSDSNHDQGSSKSSCSGNSRGLEPVTLKLTDKNGSQLASQLVNIGDTVTLDNNGSKFGSETNAYIYQGGKLIQSINFHTSCSVPLAVGDQHGGILISSFTPEGNGSGKGSHGHKGSKGKGSKAHKGSKGKGSKAHKGSKGKGSKAHKGSKAKGSKAHKGSKAKPAPKHHKGSKAKHHKGSKAKHHKGSKGKKGKK
jgi:uncharacterized repeat protein (TIGR01451 family)